MLAIFISILCISIAYSALIAYFLYHWKKSVPLSENTAGHQSSTSIVIAARNEEDHILDCVHSCLRQTGLNQNTELIVVDDQSEDDTYDLLKDLEYPQFRLMRLGVYKRTTIKGSKKKALAYGINHAQGDLILTTDADCVVNEKWVTQMIAYFKNPDIQMVCGPVRIYRPKTFLDYLQALDFSANGIINAAGINAGSHYLCSAANLAYRKSAFLNSDAFENNYDIASGDDVFLIGKMIEQYPNGICFAAQHEAIVDTYPIQSWLGFWSQRLRWAGKMRHIKSWKMSALSGFVWIQRISMVTAFILAILLNSLHTWILFALAFCIQFISDFILQYQANQFFNIPAWKKWFFPVWLIHNLYFIIIGLFSWLPLSQDWKGRKV